MLPFSHIRSTVILSLYRLWLWTSIFDSQRYYLIIFCSLVLLGIMALASARNMAMHTSVKQVEQAWSSHLSHDSQALSLCYNAEIHWKERVEMKELVIGNPQLSSHHNRWSHRYTALSSAYTAIPCWHLWAGIGLPTMQVAADISLFQNLTDTKRPLTIENSGTVWFRICSEALRGEERDSKHTHLHLPSSLYFEAVLPFHTELSPCNLPRPKWTKLPERCW